MSNETDLDWLARNVHVWPAGDHQPWCYVYWKGGHRAVSANCITVIQPCVRIEKSDWLARRAELQNKPRFSDHPDAKCFVQNDTGTWFKNSKSINVRHESNGGWFDYDMSNGWVLLGAGDVLGDWRDTLEKRPEQDEFETFTSIEDNQGKDMKQDNRWFERGELPPVWAKVMHKPATDKSEWFEVEVIAHTERYGYRVAVFEYPGAVSYSSATSFRPIRTERDELMDVIVSQGFLSKGGGVCGQIADAILAAGFSLGAK